MTLTIDLPPEIETRLRERAVATGLSAETIVMDALAEQFSGRPASSLVAAALSPEEARLMREINQGPSESEWRRYHDLIAVRRSESLGPDQHAELLVLSDRMEELHARRLENVARLARLRDVPFDRLVDELGLRRSGHD